MSLDVELLNHGAANNHSDDEAGKSADDSAEEVLFDITVFMRVFLSRLQECKSVQREELHCARKHQLQWHLPASGFIRFQSSKS